MDDKLDPLKNSEQEGKEESIEPQAQESTPYVPSGPDPDSEPETEPYQREEQPSAFGPMPHRKRNWKKLIYLLGAVLVVVVLFNVVRTLTGGSKTATPTPTPIVESTPPPEIEEATPEPTSSSIDSATGLDRSELSIAIQNGSGEAGVAKKASDLLEGLGYDIVSTGNADNFDYTDVTIRVKASEKKYLPLLIKDLSADYTIGASSSDLPATESAEALVIIGK